MIPKEEITKIIHEDPYLKTQEKIIEN